MWEKIKQLLGIGKNEKRHKVINQYTAEMLKNQVQVHENRKKSEEVAHKAKDIEDKVINDYFRVIIGGTR